MQTPTLMLLCRAVVISLYQAYQKNVTRHKSKLLHRT